MQDQRVIHSGYSTVRQYEWLFNATIIQFYRRCDNLQSAECVVRRLWGDYKRRGPDHWVEYGLVYRPHRLVRRGWLLHVFWNGPLGDLSLRV